MFPFVLTDSQNTDNLFSEPAEGKSQSLLHGTFCMSAWKDNYFYAEL